MTLAVFAGCDASPSNRDAGDVHLVDADAMPTDSAPDVSIDAAPGDAGLVGARPYRSRIPRGYDASRPTPLLILLHGYGASGSAQDLYFGLSTLAELRGFLYAYPDGTVDGDGRRYWNAFPSGVDAGVGSPDDVAYITAIIDDMSRRYNVDARRVYLVGHSNGAFMAYRYACEQPTRVAAIAGLAGAMLADSTTWCRPSARVAVLHIHGDTDMTVLFSGGTIRGQPYVGAVESVARWATLNGCGPSMTSGTTLDLEAGLAGSETVVARHDGCAGGAAELWTIRGGAHLPGISPNFSPTVYDWLSRFARP